MVLDGNYSLFDNGAVLLHSHFYLWKYSDPINGIS